MTKNKLT